METDELTELLERGRRRGWERTVTGLAEGLIGLGCLGFAAFVVALLAGHRPDPYYLLALPALPLVIAALHGLSSRRTASTFETLQQKLGQAPLGGYVRGQSADMTVALRVRYLPHGEHVFVRARLNADKESLLDYCAGPLLRAENLEPEQATKFRQQKRALSTEESEQLTQLLQKPLEKVPYNFKDGAPCQIVVDDGQRQVFRTAANLSQEGQQESDAVRLAKTLLDMAADETA